MKPRNYLLRAIPEELWIQLRHLAVDQNLSIRALIIGAIRVFVNGKKAVRTKGNNMNSLNLDGKILEEKRKIPPEVW